MEHETRDRRDVGPTDASRHDTVRPELTLSRLQLLLFGAALGPLLLMMALLFTVT